MRDGFRLALTGATGDFGRAVLGWACANNDIAEVTALGRRPTGAAHPKLRESFLDLSGRIDLDSVRGYDALVHLAYCVEEPHDKRVAYQVNVVATRALLKEARTAGIGQLVLTSSANALGVNNCGTGKQCTETDYPAGDQDNGHYYFQHKALLEHLANWYWVNVTDGKTKLAVVRPCYVVGEHFHNSGLQTLLSKVVVYPNPLRSYYQFLWDTDVVDAYAAILSDGMTGLYNVAPADHTSVADICSISGARLIPGPLHALKVGSNLAFRLRLTPFSGHWVTRGDPLLNSGLLQSSTEWRPSMSSAGALKKYLTTRDS
jgi:UDP-glucose 4-epimerase